MNKKNVRELRRILLDKLELDKVYRLKRIDMYEDASTGLLCKLFGKVWIRITEKLDNKIYFTAVQEYEGEFQTYQMIERCNDIETLEYFVDSIRLAKNQYQFDEILLIHNL